MRSGKLSWFADAVNGKRYHKASLRSFLAGLTILLLGILPLRAQSDPNLENGFKPYGTYSGSNIDSINLENGNLIVHIPMPFALPQRGKLQPSYFLGVSSKTWSRTCAGATCWWYPAFVFQQNSPLLSRGTGVGFDNSLDISVTRMKHTVVDTVDSGLNESSDMVTGISAPDGSSHSLIGVAMDPTNTFVNTYITNDVSGYIATDASVSTGLPTITDRAGNLYTTGGWRTTSAKVSVQQVPDPNNPGQFGTITTTDATQMAAVTAITDSNGNQITFGGQDTLGRAITLQGFSNTAPAADNSGCVSPDPSQPISSATVSTYTGFNGVSNQVKICYSNFTFSTNFGVSGSIECCNAPGATQVAPVPMIVSVIFLADNSTWSFQYDGYGNVTYIGLPLGGNIQYQWTTFANGPNPPWNVSRAVSQRTVTDNNGNSYIWKYQYGSATYPNPFTNTMTDPLNNDTVNTFTQLSGVGNYVNGNTLPFYVTTTKHYQGLQSAGTLLKQEDFQYYNNGQSGDSNIVNGFVTQITTTMMGKANQANQVSMVQRTPDSGGYGSSSPNFGLVTVEKKFDFGSGGAGALLNETDTSYTWQGTSTMAQQYLAANIVGLPATVQVKNAAGAVCAETDNGYDDPARLSGFTGTIPSHGTPPGALRGNLTSSSRKLTTTACSIGTTTPAVTSFTNWYDTGEVFQTIDPLGNTTTHTYDLAYDGAYSTQTCNAASQCVSGTYDFNTGLLTSFTNANATTQASGTTAGDSAHTTLYSYDVLSRLTKATFPPDPNNLDSNNNKAQATTQFAFPIPLTLPFAVTRTKSVTTSKTDSVTTTYDGLGRVTKTVHNTAGNATVMTSYDGLDHVTSVTNPYFTLSDATYGVIQTQYDALGRVTQTTLQDGGLSTTDFSNFPTVTATDPAGKLRRTRTDALGRLVEVDEPSPGTNGPGASGSGSINISGSLAIIGGTSATKATGWVSITGSDLMISKQSCHFRNGVQICVQLPPFPDTGTVSIILGSNPAIVYTYGQNSAPDTPYSVANGLAGLLNTGSPVTASVTGDSNGLTTCKTCTIWLTSNAPGQASNYSLSASSFSLSGDGPSLSFPTSTSGANLTGGSDATTTYDSGALTVTLPGFQASASYNQNLNTTATAMASALTNALNASGSPVSATLSGTTITMTATTQGAGTNYNVSGSSTRSFAASSTTLTGGTNAGGLNTPYITNYSYDTLGNLTQVNQGGDGSQAARVRSFTYDTLSRVLTSQNPEAGLISYTYDADGNMLQRTAPAPNAFAPSTATQTITYCYDALNRVTYKFDLAATCPTGNQIPISAAAGYAYDSGANGIGHLTSLTDQAGLVTYTYDVLGRMTQESRTITAVTPTVTKSVGYGYNLNGSLSTLTYPSGAVITYTPDSAGRDISAIDTANNINYVTGVAYEADNGITGLVNGGTISSSFSYNKRLQPCRITATTGTLPTGCTDTTQANVGSVFDVSYDYHVGSGDDGNVFAINNKKDPTRTQTFAYDQLNRLISAQTSGTNCSTPTLNGKNLYWANSYGYDAWGNLLSKTPTSPCATENLSVIASTNNQIVGYTYDIAGNITNDPTDGVTATFDAENRIATATKSSVTTTYIYDASGSRLIKSSGSSGTIYWHSAFGVVAESDLSGNMQHEYIFFAGQRVARRDLPGNTAAYYFADHLQRTAIVTDATGHVTADSDYYPFGGDLQVVNNDSNDYKFTGKKRDIETGLDYFGARYYSNGFGRFVTPDWSPGPATVPYAKLDEPQTLNLYSYVDNNPINGIDVDGHTQTHEYMVAGPAWSSYIMSNLSGNLDLSATMPATSDMSALSRGVATNLGTSPDGSTVYISQQAPAAASGIADSVELAADACSAQLRYRTALGGYTHAWWWISIGQDDYTLSGTGKIDSADGVFINAYVTHGTASGSNPKDNLNSGTVAFDTRDWNGGFASPDECSTVRGMLDRALSFPNYTFAYDVLGPIMPEGLGQFTSNTVANYVGWGYTSLYVPAPPRSFGWDERFPGLSYP